MLAGLRRRLFATPLDGLLTLAILALLVRYVPPLVRWALIDATWQGASRDACDPAGACWAYIGARFPQLIYGFYPEGERWRVNLVFLAFAALVGMLLYPKVRRKRWIALTLLVPFPLFAFVMLYGGMAGLALVETSQWGGLLTTMVLSVVGIAGSLPLGILLALARRSQLPVLKVLSTAFIELWRGVPLITVLFMASVMLPLFLPAGVTFDKLLRALVGVTLFSAAYMAEVVRGGLQGVALGQYEAAQALGLGYSRMMALVILPQALRHVIPGIVNTFIGLFKDTTLVMVVGMFDLLGMVQASAADPNWLGHAVEGYVFAGAVYWVFCFGMSRISARLEVAS